jgi:hypothetical protein
VFEHRDRGLSAAIRAAQRVVEVVATQLAHIFALCRVGSHIPQSVYLRAQMI